MIIKTLKSVVLGATQLFKFNRSLSFSINCYAMNLGSAFRFAMGGCFALFKGLSVSKHTTRTNVHPSLAPFPQLRKWII